MQVFTLDNPWTVSCAEHLKVHRGNMVTRTGYIERKTKQVLGWGGNQQNSLRHMGGPNHCTMKNHWHCHQELPDKMLLCV